MLICSVNNFCTYYESRSGVIADVLIYVMQEYLEKLQAIRKQNYMERKRIQQRIAVVYDAPPPAVQQRPVSPKPAKSEPTSKPEISADERRKKIAALKVFSEHLYQLTPLASL